MDRRRQFEQKTSDGLREICRLLHGQSQQQFGVAEELIRWTRGDSPELEMFSSLVDRLQYQRPFGGNTLSSVPFDSTISEFIGESLKFPSMESRENMIPEAYRSTYGWAFDDAESGPGTGFLNWLRSDSDQIYWITGKAGSGKSTLMKFVTCHPRLREELTTWSGTLPLLVSSYYSWDAGADSLQRSMDGMRRTLLYRCLKQRLELVQSVCRRQFGAWRVLDGARTSPWTWEKERLCEAFSNLVDQSGRSFRLVLFIDGLDEFGIEHQDEIIDMVKALGGSRHIKICVSSRPWTKFQEAFDQGPSLEIHKLTAADIDSYVAGSFQTCRAFCDRRVLFPDEAKRILAEISKRAEGIFLWVSVVTRHLMEGLQSGRTTTLDQMETILSNLPDDMQELYSKIYSCIDPKDKQISSMFLLLALATYVPLDAETCWRAEGQPLPPGPLSDEARKSLVSLVRRRVNTYTRGLLEVETDGSINLLHRTVKEWTSEPRVQAEIRSSCPPGFNAYLSLMKAGTDMLPEPELSSESRPRQYQTRFFEPIARILSYGSEVADDPVLEPSLIAALEQLDQTATWVANRNRKFLPFPPQASPDFETSAEVGSDKLFTGGNVYSRFHWSKLQFIGYDGESGSEENCFAGLAAQFGILCYVRAMILKGHDVTTPTRRQISLLENALFGWEHHSLRKVICRDIRWSETFRSDRRLEMVRFLMDKGQTLDHKSAFNHRSLLDRVGSVSRSNKWKYRERKAYFLEVLEEHEKRGK